MKDTVLVRAEESELNEMLENLLVSLVRVIITSENPLTTSAFEMKKTPSLMSALNPTAFLRPTLVVQIPSPSWNGQLYTSSTPHGFLTL